ncbi:hypothetical protein ACFFV8_16475 [Sphingobium indicum]|uniref:hypothetical protein n=1 Tax=Sphingobium TaxID=165695 RepID=UPI000F691B4F|nr:MULTISPECIES: hypothetical protein [Sphingobium]
MNIRFLVSPLVGSLLALPTAALAADKKLNMEVSVRVVTPCTIELERVRCATVEHFNSRVTRVGVAPVLPGPKPPPGVEAETPLQIFMQEVTF